MARIKITCLPFPGGHLARPRYEWQAVRESDSDVPADTIGECMAEAMQNSLAGGTDPTTDGFFILTTFERLSGLRVENCTFVNASDGIKAGGG